MAAVDGVVVEPEVRIVQASSAPPIPPSLKLTILKDPNSLESADECPVIVWGDYTYWPLSFIDNRVAICLVAYDLGNEVVNRWELEGARYVVTMTMDRSLQEITVLGQGLASVTVSWSGIGSVVPRNPQYFWILNRASNLACRITSDSYIRLDLRAATDDQLWLVDDGRQAIFPKIGSPDICFDHHEFPEQSTLVTLSPTNWGRTQQRWIINTAGNLKPAATNLLATGSLLNSTIVLQAPSVTASDNQLWYLKPYFESPDLSMDRLPHLIPGESFMLLNSDHVISSSGSGPLMLVPKDTTNSSSTSSSLWLYDRGGRALVNAQDGLAITASGTSPVSGAASVLASSWTGGPEQQWAFTAHGYLVCRANGLVLMVASGGDSLVLASYNKLGSSDQIWSLRFPQGLQAPGTRHEENRASSNQLSSLRIRQVRQAPAGMPHTFLKENPGGSRDNITHLTVTARVSDEPWAGTTDQIYIQFGHNKMAFMTQLFDSPSRGDVVTVTVDISRMFNKSAINLRDDVIFMSLWQDRAHPIWSNGWKLASIILKAKDEVNNLEFTNSTFQKVDQWLGNHLASPIPWGAWLDPYQWLDPDQWLGNHLAYRSMVWSSPIPWGAWLDPDQKPVDLNGATYVVGFLPYIGDLLSWRDYDPSNIDGVGQILGMRDGRLIGELLKPPRKTEVLQPSDDTHSYTWVFTPKGSIIYKLWDKTDRSQYTRHSQLGSGQPVICAGEMQMNKVVMSNYVVTDMIAMVNDASGHYKPDGGACLKYVRQKLQELGIPTDEISWHSR